MSEYEDGRNARRERNRAAVLDTVLEILAEGKRATLERVIERSGISERSIFRYFASLNEFRAAVVAHWFAQSEQHLGAPPHLEAPLVERVKTLVSMRLAFFEQSQGVGRVARAREQDDVLVEDALKALRARLRSQVESFFAPELEHRTPAVAAELSTLIAVLLSFESWDLHTRGHGRSRRQVASAWNRAVLTLLAPTGALPHSR